MRKLAKEYNVTILTPTQPPNPSRRPPGYRLADGSVDIIIIDYIGRIGNVKTDTK